MTAINATQVTVGVFLSYVALLAFGVILGRFLAHSSAPGDDDRTGLVRPIPLFDRDERIVEFTRNLTTTPPGVAREYLDHLGRHPRRRHVHPAE